MSDDLSKVDWGKPIEAYHEDGRVVPVMVDGKPDTNGDQYTCSDHTDVPSVWRASGEPWVGHNGRLRGWRIRNVAEPKGLTTNETLHSDDIAKRMEAAVTLTEFHAFTVAMCGHVMKLGGDPVTALYEASKAAIDARALERDSREG